MLEIKNLTIEIDGKKIIKNLSFVLNEGDKLAVIGEEGNGKSTLLKAIAGICDYGVVEGNINTFKNHIGYLEQFIKENDLEKSATKYLFQDEEDYYNKSNQLYKILNELKLSEDLLHAKTIRNLSGGEKVKLQLLKILLNNPDILLLDEPTNDLDLETLLWLERFIKETKKPIIYVSHDEILLEKTANQILHLELLKRKTESKATHIKTDYLSYIELRMNKLEHTTQIAKKESFAFKKKQDKLNQIKNKVEHQLNTISRSDPHGGQLLKKKMRNVKSQERKLENTELTEIPDVEEKIFFSFPSVFIPKSKQILNLDISELRVNKRILSKQLKLEVIGNMHLVITGKNGCGKTTLLQKVLEDLENRQDIKVGYMPQDYDSVLKNFHTPIDFLCENDKSKDHISLVRSYLGNLKFIESEMIGPILELSGGTKAKLFLLKLILEESNVLILDEPTRNVSPLSNPVIRSVLKSFEGSIISVSHDRKFIETIGDYIYCMDENGLHLL